MYSNTNNCNYQNTIVKGININKNINIPMIKLKNILDTYYEPKNIIYKEWDNIYLWNKYLYSKKCLSSFTFDQIINNNDNPMKIILNYNFDKDYYTFIIYYHEKDWGMKFASTIDNYTYIINSPQEFDKACDYFKDKDCTFSLLKYFRKLFECHYYNIYVS
tara:strand:+ start:1106 stop:1588 length:483 start_codon:yes stop_codon:yes gene_type:complete